MIPRYAPMLFQYTKTDDESTSLTRVGYSTNSCGFAQGGDTGYGPPPDARMAGGRRLSGL